MQCGFVVGARAQWQLRQLRDIRRDAPAKLIHGKLVDAKPAGD
jgi:hypothetical protein